LKAVESIVISAPIKSLTACASNCIEIIVVSNTLLNQVAVILVDQVTNSSNVLNACCTVVSAAVKFLSKVAVDNVISPAL